jgi:hypothetical protein
MNTNLIALGFNPQNRIPTTRLLFHPVFDLLSTGFQHFFAFSCESLSFFDYFRFSLKKFLITYHDCLRDFQTKSKGNFHSMTLYSHKTLFQPQAIRAKKQTFSNATCRHFARSRGGLLSLHASERVESYKPNPKRILFKCRYTDTKRRAVTSRRRKALFQPQAIRAKKQTFSNATCRHFARSRGGVPVTSRRRQEGCCKTPLSIVSLRT